jgi:S-sulfo-L-cysteine synthase (3-phospho-L-serine-dependent)
MKARTVLELMKDTPLVRLRGRALSSPRARLWGKLELAMPGQMKDRVALQMVLDAEASGALKPGGVLVESSSGTLAEGLARVGTVRGYRVIIVSDPRLDPATAAKLRAFGAEVLVVQDFHPTGGWQQTRLQALAALLTENPGAVWPRQYDSSSNPDAYRQLAGELLEAFGGRLGALVGSVGSGGSLTGTARALRKQLPDLRVIAVDAVGSAQFHQPVSPRLQSGHGNNIIPGNIDFATIDEVHWTSDGETFNACRELARREGIYAGGSSGATYIAASWVAEQLAGDRDVVALLPDRGDRYAGTIYSDAYLQEKGLAGVIAPAAPRTIRYGIDVAERWSRAELPHASGGPYHAPDVLRSSDLARALVEPAIGPAAPVSASADVSPAFAAATAGPGPASAPSRPSFPTPRTPD